MRVLQGRTSVPECPASCSYSSSLHNSHGYATGHRLSRRQTTFSRQPSMGGFQLCAQQEATRESQAQHPRERPADMAGRPVADSTSYEMPVVTLSLDLLCSHQQHKNLAISGLRAFCSPWNTNRRSRRRLPWQALGCTLGTLVSRRATSLLVYCSWQAERPYADYTVCKALKPVPDVFATVQLSTAGVYAATVRVRPAFAGEGRYFVRVPDGELSPFIPTSDLRAWCQVLGWLVTAAAPCLARHRQQLFLGLVTCKHGP